MSEDRDIKSPSEAASDVLKDQIVCKLSIFHQSEVANASSQSIHAQNATFLTARFLAFVLRFSIHGQAHGDCSESFYKKQIESDIHSEPSKTSEERKKMLDLLKKFEEDAADDAFRDDDSDKDDDGTGDLVKRLEGVDLDTVPPNVLLEMLPPTKRDQFLKLFSDPTSQLATQLLGNAVAEEIILPWWESRDFVTSPTLQQGDMPPRRYGTKPAMISVPPSMIKDASAGQPLVFNLVAICIAYAYATRRFGVSPLASSGSEHALGGEIVELLARLIPFLTERRSTILYRSLEEVTTGLWSRFEVGEMTDDVFSLLSRDAATLLQPRLVTETRQDIDDTALRNAEEHPNGMAILALSDLSNLLSQHKNNLSQANKQQKSRVHPEHAKHKLLYYAAQTLALPSEIMQGLSWKLNRLAERDHGIATLNSPT